ncbi:MULTISPECIES: SAM hydrolase/SAM-dependent halogenase family protein [Hymenobacter]|uniref:SAM-dependent chlorinase/fluorinase n=2 Tax=Hymenobacter TaxID=89966 RepID=A0ABS6WUL0_9BACT|nr:MULTISPECIES: SAM-dependent chlorinase/fluorinase [Hymenobacter]MBO3271670.1 SAM-dependent chlorinase/fluorinase [Hymenobacter defluvii]MBW3127263.1 SAM-dependent chlorinase/fluorinase [Hymenobacter profundi]
MGLITFLSDFGYRDHYVAAVKARMLQLAPAQAVLDISHAIEPFNIAHAVHVLQAVFRDFPLGTVHLIGVNDLGSAQPAWHAASYEGHYFVVADNGILSLLTEGRPEEVVRLQAAQPTPSPTRDILTPAAVHLAQGGQLTDLGLETATFRSLVNRQLRLQDHRITGHVVHIDHYGNLITDITRTAVDAVGHGRAGTIHFARETVRELHLHYQAAPPGDVACIFNSQDQLCIGINQGNAAELLGLHFDSQIEVHFPTEASVPELKA